NGGRRTPHPGTGSRSIGLTQAANSMTCQGAPVRASTTKHNRAQPIPANFPHFDQQHPSSVETCQQVSIGGAANRCNIYGAEEGNVNRRKPSRESTSSALGGRRRWQDFTLALPRSQLALRLQEQRAITRQLAGREDFGGLLRDSARLRRATSRGQGTRVPKLRNSGAPIVAIEPEPERCRLSGCRQ